ncbi:phage major capsid protein [Clostridium sp. UBA1652]|uniref:phage major capsid protein n=1 Tax=Clostridium sp. UBA1652 TaxID=1946348 RepID=UPI00257B62CB|nr:phage major capsid protein [Clostridium sp. UBA1652]
MKVKEIRDAIEAKKIEVRGFLDKSDLENSKKANEELRALKESLVIAEELEEEEKRDLEKQNKVEERKDDVKMENNKIDLEFRAISKILARKELTEEERASVNVSNSGAILPQAFIAQVQLEQKGFPALKPYCHVIPVTTNTGKMPVSKGSTTRKLAKLATDTAMVQEMITTEPIEFAVEDYGKIYPVENSVLEDAGVDFYNSLLAPDVAECSVNSENEEIIEIIEANKVAGATGTDYKAIQKTINKVVPALKRGLVVVTNVDGYDYLDGLVDSQGRPLLTDSLAVEGGKMFKGKEVVVMDNADLVPATEGKLPFYVVNLYALVKFFDRKQYEIATSKEAGFVYNQTFTKVVERFDVVKGDARACFYVEL